jgi:predicted RNase H-like HicB family nuclease
MNFAIVFEKTATGFSAFVPEFPRCLAKDRERAEVESEMKRAVQFHVDGLM